MYAYDIECPRDLYPNDLYSYAIKSNNVCLKDMLLLRNMEVYYTKCLLVRKVLKLYIRRFLERYYSPNGNGFIRSYNRFINRIPEENL